MKDRVRDAFWRWAQLPRRAALPRAVLPARPGPWTIVHVVTELALGGAQRAVLAQCAAPPLAGARVVLVAAPGGLLAAAARLPGLVRLAAPALARDLDPCADAWALVQLIALFRALRAAAPGPLLVHTHSSKAGVLGRLAAAAAGAARIVHSIHGFGLPAVRAGVARALVCGAERAAAKVTDGFTSDCARHLHEGRRLGLVGGQPCAVVHCGIDVEALRAPPAPRARLRRALGLEQGDLVVLQLANLKPQKDPLTLVAAAVLLARRLPALRVLLAGDGPLRPRVAAAIAAAGLGDRVRLLGWRHDVPALLHACDVVCLSSLWEGLPQVFAQAMAAGRPIVATDVDGAYESVGRAGCGILVPPAAPAALASALAELLRDPARRNALGAAGRRAAPQYSEARMRAALAGLYAEVGAGSSGASRSPAAAAGGGRVAAG